MFEFEDGEPYLVGGITPDGTYTFPFALGGHNPDDGGDETAIRLSRHGRIWSYTNSAYPPPPPYIVSEPYEPIVVAAVELDRERLVVLGQVAAGWMVEDLHVGMAVELVIEELYEADETSYTVWKWRPVEETRSDG
jgi:uncharacterized OB-fold protein